MSKSRSLHGADVRKGDRPYGRRIRQEDALHSGKTLNYSFSDLLLMLEFILSLYLFKLKSFMLRLFIN